MDSTGNGSASTRSIRKRPGFSPRRFARGGPRVDPRHHGLGDRTDGGRTYGSRLAARSASTGTPHPRIATSPPATTAAAPGSASSSVAVLLVSARNLAAEAAGGTRSLRRVDGRSRSPAWPASRCSSRRTASLRTCWRPGYTAHGRRQAGGCVPQGGLMGRWRRIAVAGAHDPVDERLDRLQRRTVRAPGRKQRGEALPRVRLRAGRTDKARPPGTGRQGVRRRLAGASDDPHPPNGYNCRCRSRSRCAARYGGTSTARSIPSRRTACRGRCSRKARRSGARSAAPSRDASFRKRGARTGGQYLQRPRSGLRHPGHRQGLRVDLPVRCRQGRVRIDAAWFPDPFGDIPARPSWASATNSVARHSTRSTDIRCLHA